MKVIYIVIFLGLIFLSTYFIIFGKNGYLDLCRLKEKRAMILKKNQEIQRENRILAHRIKRIKSDPTYLEEIIREKMGLVKEGEVVFVLDENK